MSKCIGKPQGLEWCIVKGHVYAVSVLGGGWMILNDGIQWSPPGLPRDASGCGSSIWDTIEEARKAWRMTR